MAAASSVSVVSQPVDTIANRLDLRKPLRPMTGCELAPELSDEILGRTVMIREVPRSETRLVVGKHLGDGASLFDVAMRAGDLPHAVENAADPEAGGELVAARCG